jgi:hypothetical protein
MGSTSNAARELLLKAGGFPTEASEQIALAARLAERIEHHSPRLGFELAKMPHEKDGEACVIHGLPAREGLAAIIQLALSTLLGDPFNYAEQNKGVLAMRLEPQPGSAANTNTTTDEFALHSDDAAMPEELRAEWLSLYGIRNPRGTLTGYAPIRVVLDDLANVSTDIQATLAAERFSVRMP